MLTRLGAASARTGPGTENATRSSRGRSALRIAVLVLAFVGYLDALYLTIAHYRHVVPSCSVIRGCEAVLTGRFSSVFGIPTAALGVAFYLVTFYLAVVTLTNPANRYCRALKLVACLGLLVSGFLFFVQLLIVKAFCQYCVISAVVAVGIFLSSLRIHGASDRTYLREWW